MTLRFALAWTPTARVAAVLGTLAAVGIGIATASPEAVVARRFTAALETAPGHKATAANHVLVSGSEAYWLADKRDHEARGASLEPAAWSAPFAAGVSVGDRITISAGKTERVLEVVAMSVVVPPPAEAGKAESRIQHMAVTCRDLGTPDGRLVTFLSPVDDSASGKAARTL